MQGKEWYHNVCTCRYMYADWYYSCASRKVSIRPRIYDTSPCISRSTSSCLSIFALFAATDPPRSMTKTDMMIPIAHRIVFPLPFVMSSSYAILLFVRYRVIRQGDNNLLRFRLFFWLFALDIGAYIGNQGKPFHIFFNQHADLFGE